MTEAVASALSVALAGLKATLTRNLSAPSPEAEFARWVFDSTSSPVPFDSPSMSLDVQSLRLGRAPLLAGVGYRLGSHKKEPGIEEVWREGFRRLMGTNPFPSDRISFAYRAIDLLGLALGTRTLDWEDGSRWLRDVASRRIAEEQTSTWPGLLYLLAGRALGLSKLPPAAIGTTAEADLSLLAFVRWWWAYTGEPEASDRARQLDESLLSLLARENHDGLDVPAAAVILQASDAAVRRRVAWYVSASEGALPGSQGSLGVLVSLLRRFHVAVQQLQRRYGGRPPFPVNDEYDAQDLLHAVLKFHFDDVRAEEWTPSYGGRSSRMDFLLKPERIIVELKMTRNGLGQKELTQELTIDKEHYRAHPDCGTLVCFVYDPEGRCTNPAALESDLSRVADEFKVVVLVVPTGT